MLPAPLRMRSSAEFRLAARRGVRVARGAVVVHARRVPDQRIEIGFVVSKAVGHAVTRNRVKRRLRHLVCALAVSLPPGTRLVVRALPAAAHTTTLGADLTSAWTRCLERLAARSADPASSATRGAVAR